VFCEGVQHRLLFCLHHLSCVKMVSFQFHVQLGKQKKVGWVGKTVMLIWSKISWWKNKCDTVCCRDAAASSLVTKIQGEIFAHFYAVAVICHSSMQNWLFYLLGRILCEQFPWCHKKWWACSWLCSSPVSSFSVCPESSMPFKHRVRLVLFLQMPV
jgi:hypothetical protein